MQGLINQRGMVFSTLHGVLGLLNIRSDKMMVFPGPKVAWLVGNSSSLMGGRQIYAYQDWAKEYGPSPYALILASETVIVFPDAEDARLSASSKIQLFLAFAQ